MFSPRSVMALLAVLVLSGKVAESDIAAPETCAEADVGIQFCLTCKTKAKCDALDAPPLSTGDCTVAGEACTVLAGIATCRPIDETDCSCDKAAQCDAYDPDSVLICLSEGVTVSNDCSLNEETCVDGACVMPATTESTVSPGEVCTGVPDGFTVITPMCTTGVYCASGASAGPIDCEAGTYFDVAELGCMPIPPVPCAGCDTGACPDKSDCSKWYICDGGVVLDEETCEEATPDFDIVTNECLETGTGTCTGNNNCNYGIETTTSPVTSSDGDSTTGGTGATTLRPAECTAVNVGQHYPYEGNCKMYWSCVEVSNGKYDYVVNTCLGDLVFNADSGLCDTTVNVPGCDLTSTVSF